jgi:glycosyltransferase involved in cell wall biosynthesis
VLVHYGRVNPKKGIPFVLECLPKLCEQFSDLRYVIAGGDDPVYRQELNRIIEEKGISNQVIFTGLLDQADGIRLLRDADLFVLPSLSENFGMSVVEAMLCETAVIVSDQVGISADLARANCARVVSTKGDELHEAILGLLVNEEQRAELGLKGARFVRENYTEEPVKEQLGRFLEL